MCIRVTCKCAYILLLILDLFVVLLFNKITSDAEITFLKNKLTLSFGNVMSFFCLAATRICRISLCCPVCETGSLFHKQYSSRDVTKASWRSYRRSRLLRPGSCAACAKWNKKNGAAVWTWWKQVYYGRQSFMTFL